MSGVDEFLRDLAIDARNVDDQACCQRVTGFSVSGVNFGIDCRIRWKDQVVLAGSVAVAHAFWTLAGTS